MENLRVSDFYQAVILKTVGVEFLGIQRGFNKRAWFIFKNDNSVSEEILIKHTNGKLKVSSREMVNSIHELKSILYSEKGFENDNNRI